MRSLVVVLDISLQRGAKLDSEAIGISYTSHHLDTLANSKFV